MIMLDNQKQPQTFDNSFAYEDISNLSLPPIENMAKVSSQIITSTSGNYQSYKYWNPATIGDAPSNSQVQVKHQTVDQLIGEQ